VEKGDSQEGDSQEKYRFAGHFQLIIRKVPFGQV
jgi:hypothetical protein